MNERSGCTGTYGETSTAVKIHVGRAYGVAGVVSTALVAAWLVLASSLPLAIVFGCLGVLALGRIVVLSAHADGDVLVIRNPFRTYRIPVRDIAEIQVGGALSSSSLYRLPAHRLVVRFADTRSVGIEASVRIEAERVEALRDEIKQWVDHARI
jgi:hypothetical protein